MQELPQPPGLMSRMKNHILALWAQATAIMEAQTKGAFWKDSMAAGALDTVITLLVMIVLVASLVGVVADQIAAANTGGNITATDKALLGLLTLVFILVPVIIGFSYLGKTRE